MTLPTQLLWLDLETTGLDPHNDMILEVACFPAPFLDPFVNHKESVTHPIMFRDWEHVSQEAIDLHSPFGLISECVKSKTTIEEVEAEIVQMLIRATGTGITPLGIVLAGSSVHFDLGFIRVHMPRLSKFLHYRIYDVSAVRNFAYSLGMPEQPPLDPKPHRAMADVLASHKLGRDLKAWFDSRWLEQKS